MCGFTFTQIRDVFVNGETTELSGKCIVNLAKGRTIEYLCAHTVIEIFMLFIVTCFQKRKEHLLVDSFWDTCLLYFIVSVLALIGCSFSAWKIKT